LKVSRDIWARIGYALSLPRPSHDRLWVPTLIGILVPLE
jgi:hypothetical protein